MIRIICPQSDCGKTYRVPADALGRNVTCQKCGCVFVARQPEQNTMSTAAAEMSTAAPQTGADLPSRPENRPGGRIQPPAKSAPSSILSDGHLIGRFEVKTKLGQGAFGAVYRAYDPQLDRDVAIKVPQMALLTSPEMVDRFLREAQAAARLNHPHIVPVYDAGKTGEQYYIAAAYIDGKPLSDLIDDYRGDYRRLADLVRKLAEAIAYAHAQEIIHRDIKPHNVMIDTDGEPHLMDFGLAHVGDAAQKLTHDGTVMGTPAYMSPEQAQGDPQQISDASDQYSLGVILYELLTGETPFSGPPSIVIFNVLNQLPIPPRQRHPEIPRDLETICLKSTHKQPELRYPSGNEFALDLQRWLDDEPIKARKVGSLERFGRWCRREPRLAILVLALFFAGLISFGTVGIVLYDANGQGQLTMSFGLLKQQTEESELKQERLNTQALRGEVMRLQSQYATVRQDQTRLQQENQRLQEELTSAQSALKVAHTSLEQHAAKPPPAVPSESVVQATSSPLPSPSTVPANVQQDMNRHQRTAESLPSELSTDVGLKFRKIPNGSFELAEGYHVAITKPYYISTTEITVNAFARFIRATKYRTTADRSGGTPFPPGANFAPGRFTWSSPGYPQSGYHPVVQVSWRDAVAYCKWLTTVERVPHRLPTLAEWEWACRAGSDGAWCCGDGASSLPQYAWFSYNRNSDEGPAPVAARQPNAWGLFDTHGNVAEWVSDARESWPRGLRIDPYGPDRRVPDECIIRGGAFDNTADECRLGMNNAVHAEEYASYNVGIRVVREIPDLK